MILTKFLIDKLRIKFVSDTIWTLVGMGIVGCSGLLLQTLINGYYSTTILGVYSQVIVLYTLFTAISCMGIETSTLKYISEHIEDKFEMGSILTSSILIMIVSSALVISILYVLSFLGVSIFSTIEVEKSFSYIVFAIPLFAINKNFIAVFNAARKMKQYSIARTLRWTLICLFTIISVLLEKGIECCLYAYFFAELILVIYFLFFFRRWFTLKGVGFWIKKHLVYGLMGLFMTVISEMNNNLLVLIAGYYLSLKEIGIIAFVMTFTKTINIISSAIQINFNPLFVECCKKNAPNLVRSHISKIFRIVKYAVAPLFASSLLTYYLYTSLFMGSDFNNTFRLYIIVAVGALLSFCFQWTSSMLILSREFKGEIIRVIVVVVFKICVTYLFTKYIGIAGNLLSYTVTELISVAISFYLIDKLLHFNLLKLSYS